MTKMSRRLFECRYVLFGKSLINLISLKSFLSYLSMVKNNKLFEMDLHLMWQEKICHLRNTLLCVRCQALTIEDGQVQDKYTVKFGKKQRTRGNRSAWDLKGKKK
jgi:hypothetical protein